MAKVFSEKAVRRRFLLPGESAVAFIGIALAFILLATIMGSAWWALHTQRSVLERARLEQIRAIGSLLASSAESMLTADALSAVRRIMVESAARYDLNDCRIVTAEGATIAASDPSQINVNTPAATWPEATPEPASELLADTMVTLSFPLSVDGRSVARLVLTASTAKPGLITFETQTGAGAIGVIALLALLGVYRHSRAKLRTAAAIREALGSMRKGRGNAQTVRLSADLGHDALTWNALLDERETLEAQLVTERATRSSSASGGVPADLGAACDAMSQGLVLLDCNLTVLYANGAAAVFMETSRDQTVGHTISELITDKDVLAAIDRVQARSGHHRGIVESDRRDKDSGAVLRFIARPVRRGDAASAMLIIEDVTQQRMAEDASYSFVAQASHELRAPLTNIRLHVESAMEDGEDDPQIREQALNVINQEAHRLDRIVGAMLSMAEIDAGSFSLSRDDVAAADLFTQLEQDYGPRAKEQDIELVFDLPPKLPVFQGDRDKIMLALHNLIGNAIKYTPSGGRVDIRVEIEADQLSVQVTDTGIGISAEDAEHIFEKFYRAKDKRVTRITGSGLGLALARQVIQLHGGDITVDSRPDKGSTFTLALPVEPMAA